jgi:hypothetical protein
MIVTYMSPVSVRLPRNDAPKAVEPLDPKEERVFESHEFHNQSTHPQDPTC